MQNPPKIRLIQASINDYPTIQNMARFYVYDRSGYMGWECPDNGMFECIDFKHYFENSEGKAFLIKVDNELAGFVLLDKTHLIEQVDWNMGEFFILAKFQSKGIGSDVVRQVFQQFPGKWSIAVMPENLKALGFWRKIIQEMSGGKYTEILKTEEELKTPENPEPDAMVIFTFTPMMKQKMVISHTNEFDAMIDARQLPLKSIQQLLHERYSEAKTVFWAGSAAKGEGNCASDLDLIIVYEHLPNAYREAFIYNGWPIDAFLHDTDTLRYFFEESRTGSGISGTIHMILEGKELTEPSDFSKNIRILAKKALDALPTPWDKATIDKERFLITDVLEDIKYPVSRAEQIASTAWLYEALSQFYFRSHHKWRASGKSIVRYLKQDNSALCLEFNSSFEILFQTGNSNSLERLVEKILEPFGGLLWDGFRSDAPSEWKVLDKEKIFQEIKLRELIFHHPKKFGKTKQDIENQMCDEFWEVGASGNIYTRQDVIETLLERYNDPNHQDIWETSDFKVTQIVPDNYLLTYNLIQNHSRRTRRSTLWRRVNGSWKILYHQGTVIGENGV